MTATLSAFPTRVRASLEGKLVYERQNDRYALRGRRVPTRGADLVLHDTLTIAVFSGLPPARQWRSVEVVAVYRLGDSPPAVPTGRVFVRLAERVVFKERAGEFATLGYRVAETLSYAPHAGWLVGRSVAEALQRLGALATVPDVENVEPQMLTPADRKAVEQPHPSKRS